MQNQELAINGMYWLLSWLSALIAGVAIGALTSGRGARFELKWLAEQRSILQECHLNKEFTVLNAQVRRTSKGLLRRIVFYQLLLLIFFNTLLFLIPSPALAFTQMSIIALLCWLSAQDIDNQWVPDKEIMALVIYLLSIPLVFSNTGWVNNDQLIQGLLYMLIFIALSVFILRFKGVGKEVHVFGDGDTLILSALALYYGVDALTALGFASSFFICAHLLKAPYLRLLRRAGHAPITSIKSSRMAFIPFIMLGTFAMIALAYIANYRLSTQVQSLISFY